MSSHARPQFRLGGLRLRLVARNGAQANEGGLHPEQLRALDQALSSIRAEVLRAAHKHGARPFASPHEGAGVILEEVDEFWDEIKANNADAALAEVTQVGAMAAFYLLSFARSEVAHA